MKQGLGYIGSKYSLLKFIRECMMKECDIGGVFCDIFSGTNIVSKYFADDVDKLIINDLEYYSYVLANGYFSNVKPEHIDYLNNLKGIEGNIFNEYSQNGKKGRLYFSEYNGRKIDAIRNEIDNITIGDKEYYYYLSSLIESVDKVANTTSVYGAYLKKLKEPAKKFLQLKELKTIDKEVDFYNTDANELIKEIEGDILYIDPPYNNRQYGANYHVLNTILKYDFSVEPRGITGIMDYNKSKYSKVNNVKDELHDLVSNANFNHIFFSYNNEGLMSKEEILKIINSTKSYEYSHKTYKADSNRKNKSKNTIEYLFYIRK